jgi:Mrp family chromosome partitioning ATPase
VLLGEVPLSAAIQPVAGVTGLSVLSSGVPPVNPSEVLSSPRAAELIATLRASGWTILLDSPPVLPVTDASVVSSLADVTLLVASNELTKKHDVKRAVDLLDQVHAPLAGSVLNRAAPTTGGYYGYRKSGTVPTAGVSGAEPTSGTAGSDRSQPEQVDSAAPAELSSAPETANGTRKARSERRS